MRWNAAPAGACRGRRMVLFCLLPYLLLLVNARTTVAADVRFAVIGDYGNAARNAEDQGMQQVATMIDGWNPDIVVTAGDNNYSLGEAATIDNNIGQFYQQYIGSYTGGYGPGAGATNRFYPAIGNHDNNSTAGYTPYTDYFTLPGNERYYDFVQGPVHFFMLNSTSDEPDGYTSSSTQAAWLQTGLQASTAAWQVVVVHHSPYGSAPNSSRHGSDPIVQWDYKAWGADAVLSGHNHFYERFEVGGLPYIVTGAGGHDLDDFSAPIAGSKVRNNGDYGALLVDANESTLSFKYYTRDGRQADSFNIGAPNQPSLTRTFQQGVGYTGTVDTFLQEDAPNADNGAAAELNVDADDPVGSGLAAQVVLRFDDLFGAGPGQIALDDNILSATLEFETTNPGDGAELHRILVPWDDSPGAGVNATWAMWGDGSDGANATLGVQADGVESEAAMSGRVHLPESGRIVFDVTDSLLAWQADPSANHGWVFLPTGTDGWDFFSAEGDFAPLLTVRVPEPATFLLLGVLGPLACSWRKRRAR